LILDKYGKGLSALLWFFIQHPETSI